MTRWLKRIAKTALVLCLFYSLTGLVLVPAGLHYYLTSKLPETIHHAVFLKSVSFDPFRFNLTLEQLDIHDERGSRVISAERIRLDFPFVPFKDKTFSLEEIVLKSPYVSLALLEDGSLNLSRLLPREEPSETDTEQDPEETDPVAVLIETFRIDNGSVEFRHTRDGREFSYAIRPIHLVLDQFSTRPDSSGTLHIVLLSGNQGHAEITGTASMDPAEAELLLTLREIDLKRFQPYLDELVDLKISEGLLSASGRLSYSSSVEDPLILSGTIHLNQFGLTPTDGRSIIRWDSLILAGFKGLPLSKEFHLDGIYWDGLNGEVILHPDGTTNWSRLRPPDPAREQLADKNSSKPEDKSNPISLTIEEVRLRNAGARFVDRAIQPAVEQSLSGLSLSADDVRWPQTGPQTITLNSKIGPNGSTDIRFTLYPETASETMDLSVRLDNFELTPLTPYTVRALGFPVESGKLSFDSDYGLADSRLEAKNNIAISRLELGAKQSVEGALNVPLKLALSLLEDRDRRIEITLPIEGNPNDPDFRIGQILRRAFTGFLTKVATSPFSILSGLVGGDSEDLQVIAFSPGRSDLAENEQGQVSRLAEALLKRPKLILEIEPVADKEKDALALRKDVLDKRIQDELSGINSDAARDSNLKRFLEAEYKSHRGYQAWRETWRNFKAAAKEQGEKPDEDAFFSNIRDSLIPLQDIPDNALENLARRRAESITAALLSAEGLSENRVYVKNPKFTESPEESEIHSHLSVQAK